MKKMKRFASAALAALLLAGSAPSALALDTTPPMYEQFVFFYINFILFLIIFENHSTYSKIAC